VTVNVSPRPTVSISTSPASITSGQSSTLSWSSANATSVAITPGIGTVGASGSKQIKPTSSTTYTAVASGAGGNSDPAYASVTVDGKPTPKPPKPPAGTLSTLQLDISVPYLVGNMNIPVKIGSFSKDIEVSPDKKDYPLDVKEANISLGSSLTIVVGGNKTLIKKVQVTPTGETTTVSVGDLILGDITGDNKIDDKDSVAFLDSITKQTLKGDFNADKVANSLDWAILLANFGKSGDL
jgi:hypothetical protein